MIQTVKNSPAMQETWVQSLSWGNPLEKGLVAAAAAAVKSLQSCPTLCDPIEGSPPGSPVPGILQARTLKWVAISFSNAWKWKVKVKSFSHARLLATPWTAAYQAPPSMGFSRQEYWSGVPLPSPRDWLSTPVFLPNGEGNGNPFQYSYLENPVDRGAWWAVVHGVTQSQTRLKRLSMHACIGEGNGNPL